jgi:hypothetical protein
MKKIVINDCHGGFSVSDEALVRYARIKEIKLWAEKGKYQDHYYRVAPEDRAPVIPIGTWHTMSMEERTAHNERLDEERLTHRDFKRDDPALIQVIEEMGKAADGKYASLKIVEIPDDVEWEIQEYDGMEWVAEKHRTWS